MPKSSFLEFLGTIRNLILSLSIVIAVVIAGILILSADQLGTTSLVLWLLVTAILPMLGISFWIYAYRNLPSSLQEKLFAESSRRLMESYEAGEELDGIE